MSKFAPQFFVTLLIGLFSDEILSSNYSNTSNASIQFEAESAKTSNLIEHMEPPFWWVGMENKHLQLMLHGTGISEYEIRILDARIKLKSLQRTDNRNYLFIDLEVSSHATSGPFEIELLGEGHPVGKITYQLYSRKKGSAERKGFDNSDVIYLITPDRYANGDYTNDEIKSLKEGIQRKHEGGRHGGDIQGVIDHLDYLAEMGYTQLWLNPVLENNQEKYSYHGYSTTDYYQIDKRYGDNALYLTLSQKAKRHGIGLIKDIILNHIGSEHWWMDDQPTIDWINQGGQYKATTHKRESLNDPHGVVEDRNGFTDGWFVPSMPDLNQTNPLLATYLIQNSIWWVEYAELSGIRLDTYSYSDKDFLSVYTERMMREYPNLNLVGEEWTLNPSIIAYWQRGARRHDGYHSDLPSLMDFPLQDSLVKALIEKESWSDGWQKLYSTLASDFIYASADDLVIFPDNHDMSRIYTQLGHDEKLVKMAIAFFATTRGTPQIFYGTEILMGNRGSDSHGVIRADFPGGWKEHKKNAFTGIGLSPQEKSMQDYVRQLLTWRKQSEAIHFGKLTHYAPQNGVYVYFRHHENDKIMVIMNKNDKVVEINPGDYPTMLVSPKSDGEDVITGKKINLNKTFEMPAKSAMILDVGG